MLLKLLDKPIEKEIKKFIEDARREDSKKPRVLGKYHICQNEEIIMFERSYSFPECLHSSYGCTCLRCYATQKYSPKEVVFIKNGY